MRSLRKRKPISYDVHAIVREERRSTSIAAKQARREKAYKQTLKNRRERQKRNEEKRLALLRERWTPEKKEALMQKYLLLQELSIKNHGTFATYEEIIKEVYTSHGYRSLGTFKKIKKTCLNEVQEYIDYYLKEEKKYNSQMATKEQLERIQIAYETLSDEMDSNQLSDNAKEVLSKNMEDFYQKLSLPIDADGNYLLNINLLNYWQCKRLLSFFIDCLFHLKVLYNIETFLKNQ